jgi:REP element-mobilizing transposase RayT
MARPLRLQYPGAWYHIMNRGKNGETIFQEEADYLAFIDLLKESASMWNIKIAAYCLMSNHYHLLIQTPDENLSRSMRHINGLYTQYFNRAYKKVIDVNNFFLSTTIKIPDRIASLINLTDFIPAREV